MFVLNIDKLSLKQKKVPMHSISHHIISYWEKCLKALEFSVTFKKSYCIQNSDRAWNFCPQ